MSSMIHRQKAMIIKSNGKRSNLQDNDDDDDDNDDDNDAADDDENGHNLVNFHARISRFCMGVDLNNTNG